MKRNIITFTLFMISGIFFAQKDSIALQREARKYVREGNELYKKKNYSEATVSYKKALEKNSAYKKASYNMGNAFYQEKNYKEAIPQYELTVKTAKDKTEKAEAFHNMGNAHMEGKNYQGAVDAFKNALRNNPSDDETRYNLAVAQKLLDKEKKQNKDKDKDKKDKGKDDQKKNKDKKEGEDKKDPEKKKNKNDQNQNKSKSDKKDEGKKQQPKPRQGKMTPQQIKQLLENLNNEEKKTQKKLNVKKARGRKVKQEKDW